jgi:hypothetical protein
VEEGWMSNRSAVANDVALPYSAVGASQAAEHAGQSSRSRKRVAVFCPKYTIFRQFRLNLPRPEQASALYIRDVNDLSCLDPAHYQLVKIGNGGRAYADATDQGLLGEFEPAREVRI